MYEYLRQYKQHGLANFNSILLRAIIIVACYIREITRIKRTHDSNLWKLYFVFFILHLDKKSMY